MSAMTHEQRHGGSPGPYVYADPEFRIVSTEIADDPRTGRPIRLNVCEEYVPESDRWEPFVSIAPLPQHPLPGVTP